MQPAIDTQTDSPKIVLLNEGSGTNSEEGSNPKSRIEAEPGVEVRTLNGNFETTVRKAAGEAPVIVAAGGDGTICGVVQVVADTDHRLGILPLGTFNYFARGLGIPEDLDGALATLRSGRTAKVSIGEVNGDVFLNNASLGLYPSILETREKIYRKWGRSRMAAYWSVLVAIKNIYRPMTMKVTIDGRVESLKSPMVFVATSAFQLEHFGLDGADAVRSGKFAVLLAPDCGRFGLVKRAFMVALRGVKRDRDFTLLTGEDVVIETKRKSNLVARDGERQRMDGPYHFRFRKDALTVIVPAGTSPA